MAKTTLKATRTHEQSNAACDHNPGVLGARCLGLWEFISVSCCILPLLRTGRKSNWPDRIDGVWLESSTEPFAVASGPSWQCTTRLMNVDPTLPRTVLRVEFDPKLLQYRHSLDVSATCLIRGSALVRLS